MVAMGMRIVMRIWAFEKGCMGEFLTRGQKRRGTEKRGMINGRLRAVTEN